VLFILGTSACLPVKENLTPTIEPVLPDAYRFPDAQTGLPVIDQVWEAVASGDLQSLRSLIEYTNAPCTSQDGLGGPPKCREGESEGTPVQVLSFLSSEGSFLRKEEIDNWTGITTSGVYAIYKVSPAVTSEQYYPIGKYVILFVGGGDQPAVAVRIGESGIVRVDTIFDSSFVGLNAMMEREAGQVILAPKS
jgi:hypothetical protein